MKTRARLPRCSDGPSAPGWAVCALLVLVPAFAAAQPASNTLSGVVLDNRGEPIEGAHVSLRLESRFGTPFRTWETHSADGGRFALENVLPGQLMLVVRAEGKAEFREPASVPSVGRVTVRLGDLATVFGMVTVDGQGPLNDVTIRAQIGGEELRTTTGPSGSYELRVQPGVWTDLWAAANGRQDLWCGVTLLGLAAEDSPRAVALAAGERRRLDVSYANGCALSGVVIDADGAPAAGATICLDTWDLDPRVCQLRRPPGWSAYWASSSATSGRDGTFRIEGLRQGEYTIRAWSRAGASPGNRTARIEGALETSTTLTIVPFAHIRGRVVDTADAPLGKTTVVLDADRRREALTDEHGAFELVVAAEEAYKLEILPPGVDYWSAEAMEDHAFPGLAAGATKSDHLFRFSPMIPVRLQVLDEDGHSLPAAVVVSGTPEPGPGFDWTRVVGKLAGGNADADGVFSTEAWSDGRFLLEVFYPGKEPRLVEVHPFRRDEWGQLAVRLSPALRGTLRGSVRSRAGDAISGALITVSGVPDDDWSAPSRDRLARSDGDGTFRVEGVAYGVNYDVTIEAVGYTPLAGEVKPVEAEKQEFVLDPPVVIRGRVVSEAGEPLSDVTVTGSAQSDEVAVTGPGGRFAIREPRWEDPLSFDAEDIFSVEKALSEFDQGKETTVIVAKRPRLACTVLDPAGVPVFVSTLETIWDGSCDGVDGSLFTDRNGRAELRPVDTCVLNLPLVVLPPPYLAKRHCLPILRPPPVFGEQEAVLQFESGRSVSVVAASDTGEAVEPYFSLPAATDEEFGYLPRIQADLDAENEVVLTPLPIDTVEVKISDVPFLPDDARFEIPAGATEVFIELSPAGVKLCTRDEFKRKGRFR